MTPELEAAIERVARAICAHEQGFCVDIGGYQGCKVGRGESYDGTNCSASLEQLRLCHHWDSAKAAIQAMLSTKDA